MGPGGAGYPLVAGCSPPWRNVFWVILKFVAAGLVRGVRWVPEEGVPYGCGLMPTAA